MKKLKIILYVLSCICMFILTFAILNLINEKNTLNAVNEQLNKDISKLTEDNKILMNENSDLDIKYSKYSEIFDYMESIKNDNKQVYLNFYKKFIVNNIDPPETIYDYTTDYEFNLLCKVVQAESGICDFDGKVNVATTIINRYFSETFPDGWEELLLQKVNGVYQYTTVANQIYKQQTDISNDTIEAIEYAFLFGSDVQDSTYFHSSNSSWHEDNLELVYEDNWHKFYRE